MVRVVVHHEGDSAAQTRIRLQGLECRLERVGILHLPRPPEEVDMVVSMHQLSDAGRIHPRPLPAESYIEIRGARDKPEGWAGAPVNSISGLLCQCVHAKTAALQIQCEGHLAHPAAIVTVHPRCAYDQRILVGRARARRTLHASIANTGGRFWHLNSGRARTASRARRVYRFWQLIQSSGCSLQVTNSAACYPYGKADTTEDTEMK
mmetsp:Transcript_102035/g.288908  ORF Transcript_102035/g.288908 Transcript_102035/m.288908 type:complete len:207 (+) Transcript_102035:1214-1834(+)